MHARTPFHRNGVAHWLRLTAESATRRGPARAAQRAVARYRDALVNGGREPTVMNTGKSRGRCPMAVLEHFLTA